MRTPNLNLGPADGLPVATSQEVRAGGRAGSSAQHRRPMTIVLVLHGLAALAGLVAPPVVGRLVRHLGEHSLTVSARQPLALILAVAVIVQSVLTRYARYALVRAGREGVRPAAGAVHRPGARAAAVDGRARRHRRPGLPHHQRRRRAVAHRAVRRAVGPGRLCHNGSDPGRDRSSPAGSWRCRSWSAYRCSGSPPAGTSSAHPRVTCASARRTPRSTATITETVEGARTVDALGLRSRRIAAHDCDDPAWPTAERYTLRLRMVWFPTVELAYLLPVVAVPAVGWLPGHPRPRRASPPSPRSTLYVQQLIDPVDRLLSWLDELQVGAASLARLHRRGQGARRPRRRPAQTPGRRAASTATRRALRLPRGPRRAARRRPRRSRRASGWPWSGPPGAGKSTLGRLLAGIHGPPRAARSRSAASPLVDLPLDELRGHVALVTQEHHVFVGTLADNLRWPGPDAPTERAAVGAARRSTRSAGRPTLPRRAATRSSAPAAWR